jgi:heat shock protein HslJ
MRLAMSSTIRNLLVLSVVFSMTATTAVADRLSGSAWQAIRLNGQQVAKPETVTLAFADGRGAGSSGCNRYSGPVTIGKGTLRFGDIMSTRMACIDDAAMRTEADYLRALAGAGRWTLSTRGRLVLTGSGGTIEFRPEVAPRRP